MFESKVLKRLFSFFRHSGASASGDSEEVFAGRHKAFRRFLSAWNDFQVTMTDLEYTLCCDHPFGLYRVHALCTNVATQVYHCIRQLEKLDSKHCDELARRFAQLQKTVLESVYRDDPSLSGPLTLALGEKCLAGGQADDLARIIDPATLRLERLRKLCPQAVPEGFVVTAVGCQEFFLQKELAREIARQVQASGGYGKQHLLPLAQSLTSLIASTDLPPDLVTALASEVASLRQRCADQMMSGQMQAGRQGKGQKSNLRLIFRGRLWPVSQNNDLGIQDPGLLLWGPVIGLDADPAEIIQALLATLARKRSAQALIYRRARGLTDRDVGMSVTCLAIGESLCSGLIHTGSPLRSQDRKIHLYTCPGLPQDMEYSTLPVTEYCLDRNSLEPQAGQAGQPRQTLADAGIDLKEAAGIALKLEAAEGCPLSLTWLGGADGKLTLLLVRPMILADYPELPDPLTVTGLAGSAGASGAGESPVLLAGGKCASPGRAFGRVFVARTWEDACNFPRGAILVVPDDQYLWASLIDDAAGIISCQGYVASRLGSLAREFGRPALFGLANALGTLNNGQEITLCADHGLVFAGKRNELLADLPKSRDLMPGSPVHELLRQAASHILPLNINVDTPDFRAANCSSYHDIARYCHEMAVSAMFSLGSDRRHAPSRVRQLHDGVARQFWIVNLNDGFASLPSGPLIDISQIRSVPMLALWRGMDAKPWQGPPPVDGKGFMSVLFEATANPDLDPTSRSNFFSEKNYFLISREYCSLHSRFGFHFVSVEARLGEHSKDNYVVFQLRGGGANIERRILRVRMVADLLWEFGFAPRVQNDAVLARMEGMEASEGQSLLAVAGYMTIHTRQLDMIMQDSAQVARQRKTMLEDCRALFTGNKK